MCMAATHKQMWSIAPLPVFTHSNFFLVASFFHLTKGLLFFSTHANAKVLVPCYFLPSTLLVSLALQKLFNSFLFPSYLQFFCKDTITQWCDLQHILLSLPMSCAFAVDSATWKWLRSLVSDGPIARARCSCELRQHRILHFWQNPSWRYLCMHTRTCLCMWFWKSRSIKHS